MHQQSEAPSPAALIQRMDRDGDGRIAQSEFLGPPQQFSRLDTNADGFVTESEIAAIRRRTSGEARQVPAGGDDPAVAAWHRRLPIILTHTHFNVVVERNPKSPMDWDGAEANALKLMNENGIQAAIIMPTPMAPGRETVDDRLAGLLRIAKKHPARFWVSGGGATLNRMIGAIEPDDVDDDDRRAFAAQAAHIISAGAVGFGELTALHFSFFDGHPFEEVRPDHPLFLMLADIAAKHGVPIDLHVEAVSQDRTVSPALHKASPANPERVRENIDALERLLAHNRDANIIWVHVGVDSTGDRSVALTRRLLASYPNLHLSISAIQKAAGDNWFFGPGGVLNPDWRALILDFPDRFMIGSDTFFQPEKAWRTFPQHVKRAIHIVRQPLLPPDVARQVAFENAQRLFRLNLISPKSYDLPASTMEGAAAIPSSPGTGSRVK